MCEIFVPRFDADEKHQNEADSEYRNTVIKVRVSTENGLYFSKDIKLVWFGIK